MPILKKNYYEVMVMKMHNTANLTLLLLTSHYVTYTYICICIYPTF